MKKEIIFNIFFTFLISLITFTQNKYFIKYLGIENFAVLRLFTQFFSYLNILELGLGGASSFALYKPLSEEDYNKVSIILNTMEKIYNKIGLCILMTGLISTFFIPFFIKAEDFNKIFYIYWILFLFSTVSTYLYIKYTILFSANQEYFYVRTVSVMSKSLYQILQIICLMKFRSFFIFLIILFLDNVTQYITFRLHFKRKYYYIKKVKKIYKELFTSIKNLTWHRIGNMIVLNTDLILISKILSLEIVGLYANYQLIAQLIKVLNDSIINVLRAKIGKKISENEKEIIFYDFKKINILFLAMNLFFSYCTYKLITSFIILWLGKKYTFSNFTVILICINIFINSFRNVSDVYKECYGFFEDIQSPILEVIIKLCCSIFLGIKYGLNGIIIGTIISNVVIILIYKPILIFKECFGKNIKDYISIYGNYLILIIISLLSYSFVIKFISLKDIDLWFNWIVQGIIVGSIVFIITFIIFLSNEDFRSNLEALKKNNNKI